MSKEREFDVAVIGAGVVGSAIAHALSRVQLRVAVLEKEEDVGRGASCRNSGVIHAGINYTPGSLRAGLCLAGRERLQALCRELNVPYRITGKLVLASSKQEMPQLHRLLKQGRTNGVPGLRIIDAEEASTLQPGVNGHAALHVPSTGIVSPYVLTIALAEDASVNGVRFFLGAPVVAIEPARGVFRVRTPAADLFSRWVVNAAGLHADSVARALDPTLPRAYPCRGEYLLLDKEAGERVRLPVYPVPPAGGAGLGVHVTPTVDGNVLIGPSAEYLSNREDTACTEAVMTRLTDEVGALWPSLPAHRVIATFAGIRAKLSPPEQGGYAPFFIEPSHEYPRLINLLGLESPALSAAPAIADRVVHEIIGAAERLDEKPPSELRQRRWPDRFDDLSEAEKARRVAADPDHGEIVCRCEGVTRHEVLHALANPLGVRTLTGLKYRCRITMGRCSGGYCLPRFVEMMRSEHRWSPERFTLRDARSPLFAGWVKEPNDGCG